MSSTKFSDNTLEGSATFGDSQEITNTGFDVEGGYFLSPDVELGGHIGLTGSDYTDTGKNNSTSTETGFGIYGRYYFSHSGVHHWVQAGMNSDSIETTSTPWNDVENKAGTATTATQNGSSMDIGVGFSHFLTESAALEVGAFSRTGSIGTWDTSSVDVVWGFSYFF